MSPRPPVDLDGAQHFLRARFGERAAGVAELGRGAWSRAFAFVLDGRELVIRFGEHREDYEIDRRAMRYGSAALPVPDVIEIGSAHGGAYAISQRCHGRFLESLDAAGWRRVLPALWRALDEMRGQPEVWPRWLRDDGGDDGPAAGPGGRWGAQLLASLEDRPGERVSGWRSVLAGFPALEATFTAARRECLELLAVCPTHAHLIHGDLLNRNVLVTPDARHLSAVYDWSCERRGDFLYDLAWLEFWAPWHPGLAAVDIRARALEHFRSEGISLPHFEARLRCYELHIGAEHLAYNAFTGDLDELEACGRRTREVLTSG